MSHIIRNQIFNLTEGSSFSSSSWAPLPRKLIITPDVYTDELDSKTGWAEDAGATLDVNNTEFMSGTGSLKLTSASGVDTYIEKNIHLDLSGASSKLLRLRVYHHSAPVTTFTRIVVYLSMDVNYVNNFSMQWVVNSTFLQNKWNILSGETWITGGNPNWNNINYIRIKVFKVTGQISINSFDLFEFGGNYKPAIVMTFDDGWDSHYTLAAPALKSKNMVATSYVIPDWIGGGGLMTSSQLISLYNNKWDIANHTKSHAVLTTLTQAQQELEFENCREVLDGLGLTRASRHVAYPAGLFNADTILAMTHWGAKTGRTVLPWYRSDYSVSFPYEIRSLVVVNTTTLSFLKSKIDIAVNSQAVINIFFHKLVNGVPASNLEWGIDDFSALLDYIKSLGLQTLTIDEYYRLYSGSITVNHK